MDQAMVLGSLQCLGILLLWVIAGQGSAVLAAGAGWVGCFLISHLSHLPFLMPLKQLEVAVCMRTQLLTCELLLVTPGGWGVHSILEICLEPLSRLRNSVSN